MHRAITTVLALALAVVASNAVGASAESSTRPTLRLLDRAPLTVGGRHFAPRESVTVRRGARIRVTRANRSGSFVLVLGGHVDRCNAVRVVAVGSGGSRAILKILPSPACPPL